MLRRSNENKNCNKVEKLNGNGFNYIIVANSERSNKSNNHCGVVVGNALSCFD